MNTTFKNSNGPKLQMLCHDCPLISIEKYFFVHLIRGHVVLKYKLGSKVTELTPADFKEVTIC